MGDSVKNRVLDAFQRLAAKRGLLPAVLQSNRFADFAVVMAAAAAAFEPQRDYSESEVNSVLKAWLSGAGAMLDTDHVELRRCLVDCRLVGRDGFGRHYTRAVPPPAFADAIEAFVGADLAAIARDACESDARARAQRKARWEASSGGPASSQ